MIVDCETCEAKVDSKEIAYKSFGPSEHGEPYRIYMLECPRCSGIMLAQADLEQVDADEWDYGTAYRLWPSPTESFSYDIPELSRNSLEEAQICYKAHAYAACAVMCGRAVEAICIEFKTNKNLNRGLQELKDKQIIDNRLFEWGNSLREHRNLSAHPTGERVNKADARDLLDFAKAICEYVFVLSVKYDEFKSRKATRDARKAARSAPPPSTTAEAEIKVEAE